MGYFFPNFFCCFFTFPRQKYRLSSSSSSSSFFACFTADFLFSFCFACLRSFHSFGSKCSCTALFAKGAAGLSTKHHLCAAVNHRGYNTWYTTVLFKKPAAHLNRSLTPPQPLSLPLEKEERNMNRLIGIMRKLIPRDKWKLFYMCITAPEAVFICWCMRSWLAEQTFCISKVFFLHNH